MEYSSDKTTKDLAKGAGIIFIGILITYIIKFFYRIIVSRYLGPENFGVLSLGDMVMNIGSLIAMLGLHVGLIKNLVHFKKTDDIARLKGSFWGTIIMSLSASVIISMLLIIFSEKIAIGIFDEPNLKPILIIFTIAIPFLITSRIIGQALLAFKKQGFDFYTRTLGRTGVGFLIIIFIINMGGSTLEISIGYLISLVVSILLGFVLLEKKVFPFLGNKVKPIFEIRKRLSFSLPLFFSGFFVMTMQWFDTFLLGSLRGSSEVGIYNVVLPLAGSMIIFLSAFSPVFYPIIAEMVAKKREIEIPKIYNIMIRWTFLFSFPIILIIFVFPTKIIQLLYGEAYVSGNFSLVILSIAYFINVCLGLTTETLICFNRTKTVFWLNGGAVIINILLNILLIPNYGIIGAAFSTGLTIILREIVAFLIVKRLILLRIDFKNYFKISIVALLAFLISRTSYWLSIEYFKEKVAFVITIGIFLIFYGLFLFSFKVFNQEDQMIFKSLKQKVGIPSDILSNFKNRKV